MRAGVAVWPWQWMVLALDYDLTKNSTPIASYKSQMMSMGAEINVINRRAFNLALRGGMLQNVAQSEAKPAITGGIGINMVSFFIDVSGAISSETVEIEDNSTIPSSGYAIFSLGLNF